MNKNDPCYASYVQILREELVPAMGCTEPIAIAYAAARARQVLGALPELMMTGSSQPFMRASLPAAAQARSI